MREVDANQRHRARKFVLYHVENIGREKERKKNEEQRRVGRFLRSVSRCRGTCTELQVQIEHVRSSLFSLSSKPDILYAGFREKFHGYDFRRYFVSLSVPKGREQEG